MTTRPAIVELTQVAVGAPLHDGRRASTVRVGIFTSVATVQAWIRRRAKRSVDDEYALVFYRAEELVLDYAGRVCRSGIYERDGTLRGETSGGVERPWGGRDPATCRYEPDQLVAFVNGESYRVGVILGRPVSPDEARRMGDIVTLGDDLYLVGLVNPDAPLDPDRYDHEHVAEVELFSPRPDVPQDLRAALRRRCLGHQGFPSWPGIAEAT